MKLFSSLKNNAQNFLESYKTKGPASYAAAEQAIGAILIADGLVGLEAPFGAKKRPGILGTVVGMVMALLFVFIPSLVGGMMNLDNMTATTTATVVTVGESTSVNNSGSNGNTCSLTVMYVVNGQEYTKQSPVSSTSNCSLSEGESIVINYDPESPGSWMYGAKTVGKFLNIFFWVGILLLISSIITFFIRLFSIIFGWKLLMDGKKNAKALPHETNLQTMIAEVKQNFTTSVFGFGKGQDSVTSILNSVVNPENK